MMNKAGSENSIVETRKNKWKGLKNSTTEIQEISDNQAVIFPSLAFRGHV